MVSRSSLWGNRLFALFMGLFVAVPGTLRAQVTAVPFDHCVYRLGDDPAWFAVNLDESSWKSYANYRITSEAYLLWVRCHVVLDTNGIEHPVLLATSDGYQQVELFADGQAIHELNARNMPGKLFPIVPAHTDGTHVIVLRVVQKTVVPGVTPGRPLYLMYGDQTLLRILVSETWGDKVRDELPVFTSYLVIGACGLLLLGLFLLDRSQSAAYWLGIYCCLVALPRVNMMLYYVLFGKYPAVLEAAFFGISMFESWALVRVSFALANRRVPEVYRIVFAACVFVSVGSVLPVFLPPQWSLPLSMFVQVTCFKPVWCIWTFACTAPFVAFWPWSRLGNRMRIVAGLCTVWGAVEGWFQFQQVVLNRETWSNQVQDWMSLAVAALVIALLGYVFYQQRLVADERAELRGELAAARQVQHLLVPDRMYVAPGITVTSAFLPAREVGGDFYLCRALPGGVQRLLLGDVSGKGVAAALTSALLLGAADRCDDLRPPAVLKELNSSLRNNGVSGFTTCLCADLLPGGLLLIANAGQLPPYRNGSEIEIPAGLPLGIDPAADYSETSLQLDRGDMLTFLSDGVVEARNKLGELFGFDRTRQISARGAQQIADAAVAFGQQDDITVLTLTFTPSTTPA